MHTTEKLFVNIWHWKDLVLKMAELVLAVTMFCGVIYFGINISAGFLQADWSNIDTAYSLINTILVVLLGLEVARLIMVHSIGVVMELMMLVIARKMLHPDISGIDLIAYAVAFAVIVLVYYLYELKPLKSLGDLTK